MSDQHEQESELDVVPAALPGGPVSDASPRVPLEWTLLIALVALGGGAFGGYSVGLSRSPTATSSQVGMAAKPSEPGRESRMLYSPDQEVVAMRPKPESGLGAYVPDKDADLPKTPSILAPPGGSVSPGGSMSSDVVAPMSGALSPLPPGDPAFEQVPMDAAQAEGELRVVVAAHGGEVTERRLLPDGAGFSLAIQLESKNLKRFFAAATQAVPTVILSELPLRTTPRPGSAEALQIRDLEVKLSSAKKRLAQAKIDFTEGAPILKDLEEEAGGYVKQISEIQQKLGRSASVLAVLRTRQNDTGGLPQSPRL